MVISGTDQPKKKWYRPLNYFYKTVISNSESPKKSFKQKERIEKY